MVTEAFFFPYDFRYVSDIGGKASETPITVTESPSVKRKYNVKLRMGFVTVTGREKHLCSVKLGSIRGKNPPLPMTPFFWE